MPEEIRSTIVESMDTETYFTIVGPGFDDTVIQETAKKHPRQQAVIFESSDGTIRTFRRGTISANPVQVSIISAAPRSVDCGCHSASPLNRDPPEFRRDSRGMADAIIALRQPATINTFDICMYKTIRRYYSIPWQECDHLKRHFGAGTMIIQRDMRMEPETFKILGQVRANNARTSAAFIPGSASERQHQNVGIVIGRLEYESEGRTGTDRYEAVMAMNDCTDWPSAMSESDYTAADFGTCVTVVEPAIDSETQGSHDLAAGFTDEVAECLHRKHKEIYPDTAVTARYGEKIREFVGSHLKTMTRNAFEDSGQGRSLMDYVRHVYPDRMRLMQQQNQA